MNTKEVLEVYEDVLKAKVNRLLMIIKNHEAVESATMSNSGQIHIEFTEPVDIEGQNVLNTFIYGGAIKKADSKDNLEDQFFEIPAARGVV